MTHIIEYFAAGAFAIMLAPAVVGALILTFLSLGNQRWTNYGVNFWSPYPRQFWTNLGIIAERETGKIRLLAILVRNCLLAGIATEIALLAISAMEAPFK